MLLIDGKEFNIEGGNTIYELVRNFDPASARKLTVAKVNDKLVDVKSIVKNNDRINLVFENGSDALEVLRHSTSHLMAQAVKHLFKDVKLAIGPAIEDGFYYDFEVSRPFNGEDLEKIEKEMKKIAGENLGIIRNELSREEAINIFDKKGELYKKEILSEIEDEYVSIYEQGDFADLCRGPHLSSTGKIRYFKLLSVAGAYWRGNSNNKMLQRIYGTAWFNKKDLIDYIKRIEEAKKRDHRKLGKELKLFLVEEEVGAGLPIYLPNGGILRANIEEYERKEHLLRGYDIVYGPSILKQSLWEKSGHYDNYRDFMYFTEIDNSSYGIKPMNCLSHIMIFKSELRSYRDLPQRYFELGTVHRHEKSGVLHGLLRVRAFTQDDAHIFCTREQLNNEIISIIDFLEDMMKVFGFTFSFEISTRPEKSIGSYEIWEYSESALFKALKEKGLEFSVNEGDGAFYGPKIDVKLRDAIGRDWQCGTIQCDFNLPERFGLNYIGEDGQKHTPVMLHRVLLGSIDRFIGVLIEHFAGAFPFWLAPTQVILITITDDQEPYARKIESDLKIKGFRVKLDARKEKMGFKIRDAQKNKIPHMIIIGSEEVADNKVSVRLRSGENKNALDFLYYISVLDWLVEFKSLLLWRDK